MVEEGYQIHHNNKLITVFSASNYCGKNLNKGAVVIIKKDSISTPKFVSYYAGKFNSKEINILRKDMVLKQLKERIFQNRSNLASLYCSYSKDGVHVTIEEWVYALVKVEFYFIFIFIFIFIFNFLIF